MTVAALVQLTLKVSFTLTVLCVGLNSRPHDAAYLLRRPGMLLRSLTSMNVAMPLAAIFLAASFPLNPAVKIALVALSASPMPHSFPKKAMKAGDDGAYAVSLYVILTAIACFMAPLTLWAMGKGLGVGFHVPPSSIARMMWIDALLPLVVGALIRLALPTFAAKLAPTSEKVATLGLLVAAIPVLITAWRPMMALVGDGTLLAFVLFGVFGLVTGHLLGGPEDDHRVTLALATASRHPGVAATVAAMLFPAQKLVPPAVILNLLVGIALTTAYARWLKHRHDVVVVPPPTTSIR